MTPACVLALRRGADAAESSAAVSSSAVSGSPRATGAAASVTFRVVAPGGRSDGHAKIFR
ncbi:hypothetical protein ACFSEO_01440 [Agromyces cerinus subsp. nitratus]|uniref:hypothetical protein n=1 Tax=Agromyces cerinus TaxID=33878 RepID=UPI00362A7D92